MFSPSDPHRTPVLRRYRLRLFDAAVTAAAIMVLLVLPPQGTAQAGVNRLDDRNALEAATPSTPAASAAARGPYRMRCWQYGRLLLDEYLAALPSDGASRYGGRITATDPRGRPLRVTELQSVACLVRSSAGDDLYGNAR